MTPYCKCENRFSQNGLISLKSISPCGSPSDVSLSHCIFLRPTKLTDIRNSSHRKCKALLGSGILIFSPPHPGSEIHDKRIGLHSGRLQSFQWSKKQSHLLNHDWEEILFLWRNIKVEKKGRLRLHLLLKIPSARTLMLLRFNLPICKSITFAASNHSSGFWMSHNC